MRAVQLTATGVPPAITEIPRPEPGPGEICVKVSACGLNFADLLWIKGSYQAIPPLPATMGLEYAGTVAAAGDGAGLSPGTRVAVYAGGGGLAEFAVAPAKRAVPIPDGMDDVTAAGFQIAYGTSHTALADKARLLPGETLVVLGAAGGVGLTAVEIGKVMGARVIAVVRGAEKRAVAERAGADLVIDAVDDLRKRIKAEGGADVVYDPVGGDTFTAAFRATRPGARLLIVGFASGEVPPVPANIAMVKNLSVIGHHWGGYLDYAPEVLTDSLATLMDWHAAGRLSPHVSHVLPLDRFAEGFDLLRTRQATGKIVVTLDPSAQ